MSNRSYNFTSAKPATGTFGSSKEIRDEFTSLQAGFATIEGEIDALDAAKVDIAGETYTGTHDFTGATVQVATPTIAAHAANKDYVDTEISSLNAAVAAISSPGVSATSTTELTVGTGSKSLTIETGKPIVVGMTVKIAYTTSATTWMYGDVTAYDDGTGSLTVYVTLTNGSGTQSAWTISLSAPTLDTNLEKIHAIALSF